jgi:hypothetical protein
MQIFKYYADYMYFYLKLFSIVLVLSFTGCTSFHTKLQNAQIGMTKREALRRFNEPLEKYRTKGRDHWVYETSKWAEDRSQGKIAYRHTLIFEEGVLIHVTFKREFTKKELVEFMY